MSNVRKTMEVQTHGQVTCCKTSIELYGTGMSVYVFRVDNMLVDTGAESMLTLATPFYEQESFDFVAITHSHEDHTGGAAWIAQNKQVPLYIHSMSLEECARRGIYPDYRRLFWGTREAFSAEALPTHTLQSENYTWNVIHTPGHSSDHVAFVNTETGVLFSGDLFVTPKPKITMRSESVATIMSSIRKLLPFDFEEMFCCHAGYIENGKQLLHMKLDYLKEISGEVLYLNDQGKTVTEISQTLFPNPHPLINFSSGEWDKEHLVRSIIEEAPSISMG